LDGYLWRSVASGFWKQRETFDGTYDFEDLIELHEFLDVREENERRMTAWLRRQKE
jgi:hypothetical protein